MKKNILLYLFLFSFGLTFAQQEQEKENTLKENNQQQVDSLLAKGMAFNDKKDYGRAISMYDKAMELDKYNIVALQQKALSLANLGEYERAIQCCKTAIVMHPGAEELRGVYLTYGNSLEAEQKQLEALKIYNQGLRLFPDSYKLYYNKGLTLWELREYDNAIRSFQNAVMINPVHTNSHYAMGGLLYLQGKRIPALLAFCTFLMLETYGPRAQNVLEVIQHPLMEKFTAKKGENAFAKNTSPNVFATNSFHSISSVLPDSSFYTTEIAFSEELAKGYPSDIKNKPEPERFEYKFGSLCALLEKAEGEYHDFYWDFYVPYYVEMYDRRQLLPFSYSIFAPSGDAKVEKWLKSNKNAIDDFNAWSDSFKWKNK